MTLEQRHRGMYDLGYRFVVYFGPGPNENSMPLYGKTALEIATLFRTVYKDEKGWKAFRILGSESSKPIKMTITDQEMIRLFSLMEDEDSRISVKMVNLERQQKLANKKMAELEQLWMCSHTCSCELIGVPCVHKP